MEILKELEKKYGVFRKETHDVEVVTTGSIYLDKATGIGGLPVGKLIEIFGAESSGKSTIALHLISEFQKKFTNRKVALFDYEHSFDKTYAEKIGVNTKELLIYQPDDQESGYDLAIALTKNEIVSLIVLDSQTAAIPKAIIEGDMTDATLGLQARQNSKFFGKIKSLLDFHKVTLVAISQTRANIGGMVSGEISTGGNALKFYSDMRWKVWKMNDKANESNKTTVDIVKNKLASPFGQAKINVIWGVGFDKIGEIIDCAIERNIIKRSGAWFTINGEKFQGLEKLKEYFEENSDIWDKIKKEVYETK